MFSLCDVMCRYPVSKYVSVAMITAGISMATLASAQQLVLMHSLRSAILVSMQHYIYLARER